jgi:hypothetical protein
VWGHQEEEERGFMDYQTSIDRWNAAEALLETEEYGVLPEGADRLSEWTAEWLFRVLLAPRRVRTSHQEEEALRHFEQTQLGGLR